MVEDASQLHSYLKGTQQDAKAFFAEMAKGANNQADKNFWNLVQSRAGEIGDGTSIMDWSQFYMDVLLSDEGKQIYGSNEQAYQEMLQQLLDDTIDRLQTVEDLYQSLLDNILASYADIEDRMNFRNDQLEHQLKLLEHQRDMIELIHGDDSYDMFSIVNQAQVEGTLTKVE